ncbi:uncharacterized protein VICG_00807 [Vittaforma corneae ATCC 50505]|uniref:Uncharacterized protein n=1 Tax=Vittaforma corneae (strain ATCC 50505) TaxID=993615 RepID=L2GNI3_VITCO|nr:uncharacterized protein VICG_00807 [Vittaforma corneae ATCC 50505]ELA42164.1 hypothetical protein VICG_00807 [Vittaforma corneae ATCC 50505]
MNTIKQKLEELYDILIEISPIASLTDDPFSFNTNYSIELADILSTLVSRAEHEKEEIDRENEKLHSEILLYCQQLDLSAPIVPKMHNSALKREFLRNEHEKISIVRSTIRSKIEILQQEIEAIKQDLDDINHTVDVDSMDREYNTEALPEISLKRLESLQNLKSLLLEKMNDLESKRQHFYDEIILVSCKLSKKIELSYEERICDLKRMLDKVTKEYEAKTKQFECLVEDIKKRESILNIKPRSFEHSLSDSVLKEMTEYNEYLKNEQRRLFDEIFGRTLAEIKEINMFIGRKTPDYPRTEESLVEMRNEVERLCTMKELYVEIADKIQKRRELLEKMTEFEKIASDPRRLFKSSFQLNSEEKFRNSAYPSLLKMEEYFLR